jgi:hypothetical protein
MDPSYSSPSSPLPAFAMPIALALMAVILIKSGFSAIRSHSISLRVGGYNMMQTRVLEGSSASVVGAILLGLGFVFLALPVVYLFVP